MMIEQQKIYSRFYFDTFIDKELSRSRLTGRPISLLLIEPKFLFNQQQQSEHHLEPLLARISEIIKDEIRASDLLCRYQRQRLAILLPETAPECVQELLDRILIKLQAQFSKHAVIWFSAITSPVNDHYYNAHSLLQQAHNQLKQVQPRP